jgi:nucleoside-diphosphate-sugar epimerase
VRDPARVSSGSGVARVVSAELTARDSARVLVEEVAPDVVFNLLGYGVAKDEREESRAVRLNALLVSELALGLGGPAPSGWSGPRLVHVGSALEAGRAAALDELAPGEPLDTYGRTKLTATLGLAGMRSQLASVVARAFTVFGPGERPGRLVPTLLAARASSGRIPLSAGTQRRDFVYVEDVARALADLAELPGATVQGGRYPFDAPCLNLASGALTSVRDFVLALAGELGLARERLGFGDLPPLPEEMHHLPVPVERLRAALGWTPPVDVRDGIRRLARRLGPLAPHDA